MSTFPTPDQIENTVGLDVDDIRLTEWLELIDDLNGES